MATSCQLLAMASSPLVLSCCSSGYGYGVLPQPFSTSFRLRHTFPAPPPLSYRRTPLAIASSLPPLDPSALRTSLNASFSLVSLCTFIVLMQKAGHLPANTAPVLSQVSFNLVIPCFLMSKVSQTIALQREGSLIAVPLIAIAQVIIGGLLGKLACFFMHRRVKFSASAAAPHGSDVIALTPDSSVNALCLKLPTTEPIDQSTFRHDLVTKEAIITAACAFGNAATLPLVFLRGMLSPNDYSSAAGYLALFMVGWSPCLWSWGYQMLSSTDRPLEKSNENKSLLQNVDWLKRLMNPPLYGVLLGILIGSTPLSHLFLPTYKSFPIFDNGNVGGILSRLVSLIGSILQPINEAAMLLGSASVPLQTMVLASTLSASISSVDCGNNSKKVEDISSDTIAKIPITGGNDGYVSALSLEGEAFWVITVIRLLVMPIVGLMLVGLLQQYRWLPVDPLCKLTILVVTSMPTAQNLVVLVQLHAKTRPLAGVLANFLLRQYLLSVLSLTIWISIFLTYAR